VVVGEAAPEAEAVAATAHQVVAPVVLLDQDVALWAVADVIAKPLNRELLLRGPLDAGLGGEELLQAMVKGRALEFEVPFPQVLALELVLEQLADAVLVDHQVAPGMRTAD